MRLASASDVVRLLGLQGSTGAEETATAALDVVTTIIEEKIDSKLSLATYVDYFSYNPPKYQTTFYPIRLRLTAGFVVPDSIEVRESSDGEPLVSGDGGTEVSALQYLVDTERGLITLLRAPTKGMGTVAVTYQAGFEAQSNVIKDDRAPAWLESVAQLAASRVVRMNPSNVAGKKIAAYAEIQAAVADIMSLTLNPHIRPNMDTISPGRSTAEVE